MAPKHKQHMKKTVINQLHWKLKMYFKGCFPELTALGCGVGDAAISVSNKETVSGMYKEWLQLDNEKQPDFKKGYGIWIHGTARETGKCQYPH